MFKIKKNLKSLPLAVVALLVAISGGLVLRSAFAADGFKMQGPSDVNNGDPFSVSFILSTSSPVDTVDVCVNFPSTVTMTGISYNNSSYSIGLPSGPAQCTSSISFSRSNIPAISGSSLLLASASFRANTSSGAINITYSTGTDGLNTGKQVALSTTGLSIQAHPTPTPNPTNVTDAAQSSSSASVSWGIPSDSSPISAFHIYRNGVEINHTDGSATSYTDTGLAPSTQYTYGVQTEDGNGKSGVVNANPSPISTQAAGCTSNCNPNPNNNSSSSSSSHKTTTTNTTQPKLDTTPSSQPVTVSQPSLLTNSENAATITSKVKTKTNRLGLTIGIILLLIALGLGAFAVTGLIKRRSSQTAFVSTASDDTDINPPTVTGGSVGASLPGSEVKPSANSKDDSTL